MTDESEVLKLIPIPKEKTVNTNLLYKIPSPLYLPYFLELRVEMLKEVLKRYSYSRDQVAGTDNMIPPDRVGDFEEKMLIMARNIALKRKQRITILAELPEAKGKDLEDFCRQKGIGFLEIIFDDKKQQDLIFGIHDGHWNPEAHKLVAEQLLSQLESETPHRRATRYLKIKN